jgi:hypothetical protein
MVILSLCLALIYLLRPLGTTLLIRSTPAASTHFLLEFTISLLVTALSLLTLRHSSKLASSEAAGLMLSMAGRYAYYKASDGRKEGREVRQSAG